MDKTDNYKTMVELSPEPIVVHIDGKIVFINRAGAELFASTPRKLIGQSIIEFVHPDYVKLAKSRMEQILIQRKPTELIEQKFVALDGKIVDVEVRARPITYHGKRAALLLFRDITAKKQLEKVSRESDTRYRQLILNSPQPIVIHSDGICVFINIEAAKLFGFPKPEEAVGQNIYAFIHPDCSEQAKARIHEASVGKHVGYAEHKMVRLDGQIIDVEVSSVSVVTFLGKPVIQSVLRDVTEHKRTEELLRTSEKMAVLGQLAAGIAHEIRNPLTALKGFVQLLKSKSHENNEYYEIMQSETWSKTIAAFDGYVFVTPEYNHATSGALKNAIDFLYNEWTNKAAGFVGYGSIGGTRAVENLRLIMGELQVADVRAQVALSLFTDFENFSVFKPASHQENSVNAMLDQVIAWSGALKTLRDK